MSAGRVPFLRHISHPLLPSSLSARANFNAAWNGRNVCGREPDTLPVPSQCPYPCHPSCLYVRCGLVGMWAGRALLFDHASHSFSFFSWKARTTARAFMNGTKRLCFLELVVLGCGEVGGTQRLCFLVVLG